MNEKKCDSKKQKKDFTNDNTEVSDEHLNLNNNEEAKGIEIEIGKT
ncbi:hypothetical protein [Inconstantimicrobium porci]|nr:hypothetical protein [Inconstantimicrobium porci]MDD6769491.1 hypothetical protein [Inconstantimicrobium porci]